MGSKQFKTFEELPVWQDAKNLALNIYKVTKDIQWRNDLPLCDQMRRASILISANISEGFERGGQKELIYFLYVAKGSSGELRSHLEIAHELGYLKEDTYMELKGKCLQISRQLSGFIASLKKENGKR